MPVVQNTHIEPKKTSVIVAFVGLYLIWGSTYLGILYAIKTIPPFVLVGFRFLLAGSILLTWCIKKGEKLPSFRSLLTISLSGVFMLFIGNSAVTSAERFLPSGFVSIIVATLPIWFVLLDKRQWRFHFSNKLIILGICIGFGGIVLLFAGKSSVHIASDSSKLWSCIILVCGTICWAIGSLFSKYKKVEGSTTMKAAVQMIAAGIAGTIAAFVTHEMQGFSFADVSLESGIAFLYLVTFGSIIGYLSYIWLLSVRPASLVGTYAYVNPMVAVLLGCLVAGEIISWQQVSALVVIVVGVVLVNLPGLKRKVTG